MMEDTTYPLLQSYLAEDNNYKTKTPQIAVPRTLKEKLFTSYREFPQ